MSESFFRLLCSSHTKVLGCKLPPLSLWHLALLEAVGSPFLTRGAHVDLGDIQIALRICRARWPKRPNIEPSLMDWMQALRFRKNKRQVRASAAAMMAHIQIHLASPEIWEDEESKAKAITAPLVLSRVASLARLGSFSLSEIWNDITPGFGVWLSTAIAEREGADIRFVSDADNEPTHEEVFKPKTETEALSHAKSLGLKGKSLNNYMCQWKGVNHGK